MNYIKVGSHRTQSHSILKDVSTPEKDAFTPEKGAFTPEKGAFTLNSGKVVLFETKTFRLVLILPVFLKLHTSMYDGRLGYRYYLP